MFLKFFVKFTEKHLRQSFFFNKVGGRDLQVYLRRDSGAGIILWILGNFSEHLFYRTPLDDCFWKDFANVIAN